ncbi:hypothetical protein BJF85_05215 [Saccharomonospora sp. CUA-673]|nr:hypothetical protein BJF85_05215 [Saccharomonospora sp. CUA-673]
MTLGLLRPTVPFAIALPISLLVTAALVEISYRCVERPSHEWARSMSRRVGTPQQPPSEKRPPADPPAESVTPDDPPDPPDGTGAAEPPEVGPESEAEKTTRITPIDVERARPPQQPRPPHPQQPPPPATSPQRARHGRSPCRRRDTAPNRGRNSDPNVSDARNANGRRTPNATDRRTPSATAVRTDVRSRTGAPPPTTDRSAMAGRSPTAALPRNRSPGHSATRAGTSTRAAAARPAARHPRLNRPSRHPHRSRRGTSPVADHATPADPATTSTPTRSLDAGAWRMAQRQDDLWRSRSGR